MKKRVLLSLTTLTLVTLACSLVNGLGGGGESPVEPAAPAAPVTDEPAAPEDMESSPETIDLSNPALYDKEAYPNFKMETRITYAGVDVAGSPKTFTINFKIQSQEEPKAQHISMSGDGEDGSIEFITIGDQSMSVLPGMGCTVFPASSMEDDNSEELIPDVSNTFKGQAERVETDVEIEGILTDRYTITTENVNNLGSDVTNITDGSVYVAQDGGYLVRIDFTGTVKTADNEFDPNVETQMNMSYTFLPVEDGSLNITPPAECADQISGDSQYPIMDGASDLISTGGVFFYTVNAQLGDVAEFYRTEMAANGWTLTNEVGGENISFLTLEFTKDGETVDVSAITTGDAVSVTITKK